MGPSFLPPDRSIEQVFQTADEAAKGACAWLMRNEPKVRRFEYCGFIVQTENGFKALRPMTMGLASRCDRPANPPGDIVGGWYHSHRKSEEFSWLDKSYGFDIARYLCTPLGLVKKLTPEGTVIVK